ncbi:hypothetical protein ABPG77_007886 [Micractinium sp. CCAP 211/92]
MGAGSAGKCRVEAPELRSAPNMRCRLTASLFSLRPTPLPPPPPSPRLCRKRYASPELALALQGITGIKLFLSGEGVAAGQEVKLVVETAAKQGIAVVLPVGKCLGLAGDAPPILPP